MAHKSFCMGQTRQQVKSVRLGILRRSMLSLWEERKCKGISSGGTPMMCLLLATSCGRLILNQPLVVGSTQDKREFYQELKAGNNSESWATFSLETMHTEKGGHECYDRVTLVETHSPKEPIWTYDSREDHWCSEVSGAPTIFMTQILGIPMHKSWETKLCLTIVSSKDPKHTNQMEMV